MPLRKHLELLEEQEIMKRKAWRVGEWDVMMRLA